MLLENLAQTGQRLFGGLDSADRFLARAMKNQSAVDTLSLAIETEGKLAHLPWEVLYDRVGFWLSGKIRSSFLSDGKTGRLRWWSRYF